MTYVYLRSESNLYTVGFYAPGGEWNSESDHGDKEAAAARVHYLNGGSDTGLRRIATLLDERLPYPPA